MNFKTKLTSLTVVTLLSLGGVATVTIFGLNSIQTSEATAHRRDNYVINLLEVKASAVSTIILDPASAETAEIFRAAENSINENYEMARKTILRAEIRSQLEQILTQWRTYDQQSRDIIKLAGEDAAAANPKVLPLYKQVFKPFQTELENFIMERRREADEAEKIAAETSSNTVWKIMAILALVIAANFVVVLNLSSSLRNGIRQIQEKLKGLKRGDLTERLPADGEDELSEIGAEVNVFIEELQQIVSNVRREADQLAASASQLSAAAAQVQASSDHQSEATAAVAARVEQFSLNIDQVSNSASEAEGRASQYGELARQGGSNVQSAVTEIRRVETAVNNIVRKMTVLGQQAHEISSIVNVIKEVADQTNLLALNAAIEAARAGESGRGFSVVADEVRNLAERTARSAQEITSMISNIQTNTNEAASVMQEGNDRVVMGVKQAELVGDSMRQINDSSDIVSGAIVAISRVLKEQRQTSGEIARNVDYISKLTHENNAAVSQVSDATNNLERMAAKLIGSVEKFKV